MNDLILYVGCMTLGASVVTVLVKRRIQRVKYLTQDDIPTLRPTGSTKEGKEVLDKLERDLQRMKDGYNEGASIIRN